VAKTLKDVPLVEAGLVQLKESGAVSKYNRYGTNTLSFIFFFTIYEVFFITFTMSLITPMRLYVSCR
jgi:hypothetical protein